MASWGDLADYVRAEYDVIHDEDEELRILFTFGDEDEGDDERTQVVIIVREVLDKMHEWVQIASPCGLAKDVDLRAVLAEVGNSTVACGLAIMGEHVVVRHSLPLKDLDIHEFTDPLQLLAGTADTLEEQFWGGDGY
ncbi:hypothetical protein AB0E59_09465 [Lentzea sp. NPDC034063]|jgi:hypothetical protein|uniref:YbjN domain-containing protein n=1 Tax=Lentzea sokolovensis TaxID=3095429 RepID=A0ABU4UND1_9PSEU|nr:MULTISPECIES: hypothetical protein [unclassified Lentzea]MDX8140980.1 hypothetical protein [Lentzea sp. BCCO 10_0061]WUD28930.1 YbjN domain-containing protein [Lentzea sp. NBC_00516]